MSKVRIIHPDGVVSKDLYTKESDKADSKGRVLLVDASGNSIPVHKQRIVPEDSYRKAVAFDKGGRIVVICPECRRPAEMGSILDLPIKDLREVVYDGSVVEIIDSEYDDTVLASLCERLPQEVDIEELTVRKVTKGGKKWIAERRKQQEGQPEVNNGNFCCPEHGVFEIIGQVSTQPIRSAARRPKKPKKEAPTVAEESTKKESKKAPAKVDFGEIKQYGELWTKAQVKFDHPTVDVQAHTLLADGPLRKLCFNTYNGTLGKRSREPVKELQLEAFKTNEQADGKSVGYLIKSGTIEDMRKKLEKSGFTKNE